MSTQDNPPVYNAFGSVPPSVSPSIPVRYWDQALLAIGLTFFATYTALIYLLFHIGTPSIEWTQGWYGGLVSVLDGSTFRLFFAPQTNAFWGGIEHPWGVIARLGLTFLGASWPAFLVARSSLTPRPNTWHIAGPKLLEGKQALQEARRRSVGADEVNSLCLHPSLRVSKRQLSRHILIYGSVGSGKTQILLPIIGQMVRERKKMFLYDVKGDFTEKFCFPIIVSPFDKRSHWWDIASDLQTPTQASEFAQSIIPSAEGNGKFWSVASQIILEGLIRSLQNERGTDWNWQDLADLLALDATKMGEVLARHYPKAVAPIANPESQTTSSVLATLSAHTKVIDDLALAWRDTPKERRFSVVEWVRDDFKPDEKGRGGQVIVQGGPDTGLTRAYISAMVNVAIPEINSPSLPDNEEGRFLAFVFDELSSIGKINLPPLIDKGRSKGVVVIAGLQDLAQMEEIYGANQTKAISSMVSTHIICQIHPGDTREQLSKLVGRNRVAFRNHGPNAQVHEEGRAFLYPYDLTDRLGPRKGRSMGPHRWGIRAVVQMGGDPLLLNFPGVVIRKGRKGQIKPEWLTKPAGAYTPPLAPSDREPTRDEIEQTMQALMSGGARSPIKDYDGLDVAKPQDTLPGVGVSDETTDPLEDFLHNHLGR